MRVLAAIVHLLGLAGFAAVAAGIVASAFFGDVGLPRLLWNIVGETVEGAPPALLAEIAAFSTLVMSVPAIYAYAWKKARSRWLLALPAAAAVAGAWTLQARFDIAGAVADAMHHGEDFYAENAAVPTGVRFPERRSLVIVLAESMQAPFAEWAPGLGRLMMENPHAARLVSHEGTDFTAAALQSWLTGIPFQYPAGLAWPCKPEGAAFRHVPSAFRILAENGWRMEAVFGSSEKFASQRMILESHGFSVKGRETLEEEGHACAGGAAGNWGFNDAFVLDYALGEFRRLEAENRPYVLLVETIDMHMPDSYSPSHEFGDYRDSIAWSGGKIAGFASAVLTGKGDDTALAVIGDHAAFLPVPKTGGGKRLYNFFAGCRGFRDDGLSHSAIDIAPTLLACAGGEWPGMRLGLGTAIGSGEAGLAERYGAERLGRLLRRKSIFYENAYCNKEAGHASADF